MRISVCLTVILQLSWVLMSCNASGQNEPEPYESSHDFHLSNTLSRYPYPAFGDNERSKPRPAPFGIATDWITDSENGLSTTQVNVAIPLLTLGTPPPLVKIGFAYTDLFAAEAFGLPHELFEYSLGLSFVRPINERWTIRSVLGVGFATDNENTSSDAWQFRGGAFAIYKQHEQLSWTFGALATGRDDLPVIPAIGAVWQPNYFTRVDFLFPRPKINFLLHDNSARQQWAYFGFGINGNTWAFERPAVGDDRLTYKDLRVVVGWESRPSASAGRPFALGKTILVEIGYVFSRELEFENETRGEDLDDGFVIGVATKF